ncbi:hypothetical protein [Pedobacter antarcticus]|uniref:hypothetical protein n=1 Tax=Pedobacter antarcticus TaxID=34086 RepID=UPI002930FA75|nr:hypothetical protein [Pedobacter antarcticus]
MSYIDELLKDFTKDNSLKWIKEMVSFFKKPRRFVIVTSSKPTSEIIPQYAFYFLIYTLSYLLLSIGSEMAVAFKTALLSLIVTVIFIIVFSIIGLAVNRTNYFKKISIFIFSLVFFTNPVVLALFSRFLIVENYSYKLGACIIIGIVQLCCFVFYPFFIEVQKKRAWRLFASSFLILNLFWLLTSFFQFDDYEKKDELMVNDPIVSEYLNTYETLFNKDSIPTLRIFYVEDDMYKNTFLVQDVADTINHATGGIRDNTVYIKNLQSNIENLERSIRGAKYYRNKDIFIAWKSYFSQILAECTFPTLEPTEFQVLNSKGQIDTLLLKGTYRLVMPVLNLKSITTSQARLKISHNNLSDAFSRAEIPLFIADRTRYFLGYVLEGIYIDYFQNYKSKPYRAKFDRISSEL